MYDQGRGVPQDNKTAMNWYTLAAEQGKTSAQHNLAVMYGQGEGVLQDKASAYMWWEIAASLGDKDAAKNRNMIAKRMTPSHLSAAQKLSRECVRKKYKGC